SFSFSGRGSALDPPGLAALDPPLFPLAAPPVARTVHPSLNGDNARRYMSDKSTPKPYEQWRTNAGDREEDAAYTFGYYLMKHCRAEALKAVESAEVPTTAEQFRAQVAEAVDTALHNVLDLVEGY